MISFSLFFCFSFSWTKDGLPFDPSSKTELEVKKNPYSFVFQALPSNTRDPPKSYEGKYVCYATNELGTAVSKEAILRTDGKRCIYLE